MTTHLHLTDEYEKMSISTKAFEEDKTREAFFTLSIKQSISGWGQNDVIFFVNWKDREDFAERIYDTIMSMPKPKAEANPYAGDMTKGDPMLAIKRGDDE
jgi:hypothetical protein